ncbi:Bis(5'-nucleosyl)-tetraphosphatase, symmetrical [hydrothermal vent metagenome]|uniref:bis(5'-nucleosyl)-tetraphosphatase (symmetrical) n=1 Tax=hydrothermal vent metagenome TaxID=652676 RepID=A0A3B0YE29_9ZZZZ
MAIWAIGDIQGCYDELRGLLDQIDFDTHRDTLWFVGDLVNRGPKSLETLRFLHHLNVVTVLGNHDLHLLASAHLPKYRKHKDTLQQIMHAEDGPELLDWLRHQPLLHHDRHSDYTLIHAGLPPQWDLKTAKRCAAEVETALRGPDYMDFLEALYGNHPNLWSESLQGHDRLRFITNCLTRLRYCDANGRLALEHKGAPGTQPKHLKPWFDWPRQSAGMKILFGHWSTLGAFDGDGVHALDTGCLWGGTLTAMRVDGGQPERVEYACPGARSPSRAE